MKLVGRTKEQDVLARCMASKESEFIAVYGRRRVGKTFLIRQFAGFPHSERSKRAVCTNSSTRSYAST